MGRNEKTHGGYGPTVEEWETTIADEAQRVAELKAKEAVEFVSTLAGNYPDRDKTYAFQGRHLHFMRDAVLTLAATMHITFEMQDKAAKYRAKRLDALEQRVEALDGIAVTKSLDVEAFDAMAEMAERLERLESSLQGVADQGLRYRGYWRDGIKAKRGDAFTHDGSVWRATQNTEDKPCNESADWQIVVRKGRDGRDAK